MKILVRKGKERKRKSRDEEKEEGINYLGEGL